MDSYVVCIYEICAKQKNYAIKIKLSDDRVESCGCGLIWLKLTSAVINELFVEQYNTYDFFFFIYHYD